MRFSRWLIWHFINLGLVLLPKWYRLRSHDRYILEQVIFRELVITERFKNILFAGCSYYTRCYPFIFDKFTRVSFSTVDPDPAMVCYGSKKNHTVGPLQAMNGLEKNKNAYDLVIVNGVFGFGIDTEADKTSAIDTAYELLRPGGRLLIGYNDIAHLPDAEGGRSQLRYDFSSIDKARWEPAAIPGLQSSDFLTKSSNRHRFLCFAKRPSVDNTSLFRKSKN